MPLCEFKSRTSNSINVPLLLIWNIWTYKIFHALRPNWKHFIEGYACIDQLFLGSNILGVIFSFFYFNL